MGVVCYWELGGLGGMFGKRAMREQDGRQTERVEWSLPSHEMAMCQFTIRRAGVWVALRSALNALRCRSFLFP